jgi:hypothetical protein
MTKDEAISELRQVISAWRGGSLSAPDAIWAVGDVLRNVAQKRTNTGAIALGVPLSSDEDVSKAAPLTPVSTPLSWTYNFVHQQNLFLYVDQLEREHRPDRSSQLATLLTEEEDRYGDLAERLERTEMLMHRSKDRIAKQRALIDERADKGRDTKLDTQTLANMVRVVEIFEQYRDVMREAVDRSAP